MEENPIKTFLINEVKVFRNYSEDNENSPKSFKQGDQIGSLERSLGQQYWE